jgi:TRAP-type C4-dicarboxylate transport system, small permease component
MNLRNAIERGLVTVLGLCLIFMTAMAFWLVFARYSISSQNGAVKAVMSHLPAVLMRLTVYSTTITEELLRFALVWSGLIGAAYVFGKNDHLAFTLIQNRIGERAPGVGRALNLALRLIVVFFAGYVLIYGGCLMVMKNMRQVSPILQWRMGYVYAILPLSGALIMYFECMNMADIIRFGKPRNAATEEGLE